MVSEDGGSAYALPRTRMGQCRDREAFQLRRRTREDCQYFVQSGTTAGFKIETSQAVGVTFNPVDFKETAVCHDPCFFTKLAGL